MLLKWNILRSQVILRTPWFEIRKDSCQTRQGVKIPEYYTWQKPDCVIVFPLTTDNHVVLIKQYRHGVKAINIDYPGGTIEDGQSLAQAAHFELKEETGYEFDAYECIGKYAMDSSYSNQFVHFVVATGCRLIDTPSHPQEETEVFTVPLGNMDSFAEKNIDCLLCSLITLKAVRWLSRK